MILLTATTHLLRFFPSTNDQIDYTMSALDITTSGGTPVSSDSFVSGAAGTEITIVAAPAASTQRQVKALSIYNSGPGACGITVLKDVSGSNRVIFGVASLAVGESIQYTDGIGFEVHAVDGSIKGVGTPGTAGTNGTIG